MADVITLTLPFNSPYRSTRLYTDGGRGFFGIWNPPSIQLDGDEELLTVQRGLDGQLDLIAQQVYGDRGLWWVIGQANKIDRPFEQVTPGMQLIIPKAATVRAALLASADTSGTAV